MSTVLLYGRQGSSGIPAAANPLPQLLQTPSGLALLELQGTINLPDHPVSEVVTDIGSRITTASSETPIGRLVFPNYNKEDPNGTAWMKPVHLYVGRHQKLTGEVKKLPNAVAVIRKKTEGEISENKDASSQDELEIIEIVKFKIIFSQRPEPVGAHEAIE